MKRPDYVKCVGFGEMKGKTERDTWCDNKWNESPFFVDVNHAALNGLNDGRLMVCTDCRKEIVKALDNGCSFL